MATTTAAVARQAWREARQAGDDEAEILWHGVGIRDLRAASPKGDELAALLYRRGSARLRLQKKLLHGRRDARGRADGLSEDAVVDLIEAARIQPGIVKAHRKRISLTLGRGCALPVLLALCAEVHGAMGLATDLTAIRWQLAPEPESDGDDEEQAERALQRHQQPVPRCGSDSRDDEGGAQPAGSRHTCAAISASLPALEDAIVAQHSTYADAAQHVRVRGRIVGARRRGGGGGGAAASRARAARAGADGSEPEMRHQEGAALWALLRSAPPRDAAGCADTLCCRLVAHPRRGPRHGPARR